MWEKLEKLGFKMDKHKCTEKYLSSLKKCMDTLSIDQIVKAIDYIEKAYQECKQIFIIGNGGSAAIASHMANDLGKITASDETSESVPRFRVISLSDNVSWITALANDLGYEYIFSEQLKNLIQAGDLLIAITGSGNSPNILEGIRKGKRGTSS